MKGQTVILVDDGIATGATFYASLGALLKAETAKIVAAVSVAPPRVLAELKMLVDDMVVLHTSEWFFGISQFYEQFPQVKDEEVIACLEEVRGRLRERGSARHEGSLRHRWFPSLSVGFRLAASRLQSGRLLTVVSPCGRYGAVQIPIEADGKPAWPW